MSLQESLPVDAATGRRPFPAEVPGQAPESIEDARERRIVVDGRPLTLPAGIECHAARGALDEADGRRLEELAFAHGAAGESYLAVEPDGGVLFGCGGRAAAAVSRCAGVWHAFGGLLAADVHKPQFVRELAELQASNPRMILAVYSLPFEETSLFEEHGFQVQKIGEEPVLDLPGLTWQGPQYAWVRRQENYCRRAGLIAHEVIPAQLAPEEWRELTRRLQAIVDQDLQGRPFPRELRHMEGRFLPEHLGRRRLFVASSRESPLAPQGFLIANPLRGGDGWAIEMYRRGFGAVRGTVPFLMKHALDRFRGEGARVASLCLIPGRGCAAERLRDSWLVRRLFCMWHNQLDFLFGGRGQEYFKSRFRPRFESRYACVGPKSNLRSIYSFLHVTGGTRVHWGNTVRALFRRRVLPVADE